MRKKSNVYFTKINWPIVIFFVYFFFITVMGVIMDFSVFKAITKFIIEYVLLVFCVSSFLLFDISGGIQTLLDLRNFICVSAIYGTLETIMKYNPLSNVISSVN